jgi:hypothetical protein
MSEIEAAYEGIQLEMRQLIEWTHQVEQLQQHPGWQPFHDYVLSVSATKQRRVLLGNATTMEEYNALTGWLRGVAWVVGADEPNVLSELLARRQALEEELAAMQPEPEESDTPDD